MKNKKINILHNNGRKIVKMMSAFVLISIIFCVILTGCGSPEEVSTVNLDGISYNTEEPRAISFLDSSLKEYDLELYPKGRTALFVNGSIVKESDVQMVEGKPMVSVEQLSEALGQTEDLDKALDSEDSSVLVDGKKYLSLETVKEITGAEASYYDGSSEDQLHLITFLPQVVISKYPQAAKKLSRTEAVDKAREQLIIAYENKFGKFEPIEETEYNSTDDEKENWRNLISNGLEISEEKDRFYVIPVVFDFWVDAYTGEVYVYYNGLSQTINKYDPKQENALSFAG